MSTEDNTARARDRSAAAPYGSAAAERSEPARVRGVGLNELQRERCEWQLELERIPWDVWGVATFRDKVAPAPEAAEHQFVRAMSSVGEVLGHQFPWIGAIEGDSEGPQRTHIHFLAAGVSSAAIGVIRKAWRPRGQVKVERFFAERGGFEYVMKSVPERGFFIAPKDFRHRERCRRRRERFTA